MAASVRDGAAAAATGRVEMDDHYDGGASDGEMDMDVEADSDFQHGRNADADADRGNDGDGDDEYALVSNHVLLGALPLVVVVVALAVFPKHKSEPTPPGSAFSLLRLIFSEVPLRCEIEREIV